MDREDRWDRFINERIAIEKANLKNVSPLVEEFADLLKSKGQAMILDIGCGLGRHLHYLAKKGFKPVGCDISEETLTLAEEVAEEAGIKLDLVRGDYLDLPFNNSIFAGVISIGTLHHDFPENIYIALREVHRVLKPDGYFAFDPLSTDDGMFGKGRALGEKLFIEHQIPHYFFDREELESIMEKLNFRIIKIEKYSSVKKTDEFEFTREKFHVIARKIAVRRNVVGPIQRIL